MLIVNSCVMPDGGVGITESTSPNNLTLTGLTVGQKYWFSVYVNVTSTSAAPGCRIIVNDGQSGSLPSSQRVGVSFTASAVNQSINVNVNKCTVLLTDGICVPSSQFQQLRSLGLGGDFFNGSTMPIQN